MAAVIGGVNLRFNLAPPRSCFSYLPARISAQHSFQQRTRQVDTVGNRNQVSRRGLSDIFSCRRTAAMMAAAITRVET